MKTKTRRMIVFICAAVLIIIGLYNLVILKDIYPGTIWTVVGTFFMFLGYFRLRI
ncbi:MAG: hypothetical protein QME14_09810 [Methanobacteriaceae archaeon]|nr:hypothetical protein [Methanobacteriaceae archaeon]